MAPVVVEKFYLRFLADMRSNRFTFVTIFTQEKYTSCNKTESVFIQEVYSQLNKTVKISYYKIHHILLQ